MDVTTAPLREVSKGWLCIHRVGIRVAETFKVSVGQRIQIVNLMQMAVAQLPKKAILSIIKVHRLNFLVLPEIRVFLLAGPIQLGVVPIFIH